MAFEFAQQTRNVSKLSIIVEHFLQIVLHYTTLTTPVHYWISLNIIFVHKLLKYEKKQLKLTN